MDFFKFDYGIHIEEDILNYLSWFDNLISIFYRDIECYMWNIFCSILSHENTGNYLAF